MTPIHADTLPHPTTLDDRPRGVRGVLASYDAVTPRAQRVPEGYDAARLRFGWREISIIFGAVATILLSVLSLRGQMDTLAVKFDGYRDMQNERLLNMQREFDELKREERMDKVLLEETNKKLSAIEGELRRPTR